MSQLLFLTIRRLSIFVITHQSQSSMAIQSFYYQLDSTFSFQIDFKIQSILNLPKVKLNGLKETMEFLVVMRDCRKLNIICCSCPGSFGIAPSGEWLGVCIHAYTPFSSCPRNRTEGQIFTNIDNLTPLHERSC